MTGGSPSLGGTATRELLQGGPSYLGVTTFSQQPACGPCRFDLKQLFIGSEGTLGLITSVAIHCPPRPLSGGR